MEQIQNTNGIRETQPAAAEKKEGVIGEPFIGKFASVDALYKAYERLEAEFTRRSQRLKALEAGARNDAAFPGACGHRLSGRGGRVFAACLRASFPNAGYLLFFQF